MCHYKIQFYDNILKISHNVKGQGQFFFSFDIPTLRQKSNAMSNVGFPVTFDF